MRTLATETFTKPEHQWCPAIAASYGLARGTVDNQEALA